jgi:2-polyprenyl-3-methyl-5-hydroxy-6-metoxy-1,4-benzoquinol methylase
MHVFINNDHARENGMKVLCPLCKSGNVTLLEKVKAKDLIWFFNRMLKSDISKEFQSLTEIGLFHCPDSDLTFFYPPVEGSESFYEKLQDLDWYYLEDKAEFQYALRYIDSTSSVLEVGSGGGAFARKIPTTKYVGLELSGRAIAHASSYNINIRKESIELHAEKNVGKYEIVCAFQVLEHVVDIHSFIKNCLSCLKPGGLLIYSVPSADSFIGMARNNALNMPPHHLSWWTDKSLEFVADIFGLVVIDIHHEKLSLEHKRWYASTLLFESFRNLLGLDISVLDISLRTRLLSYLSHKGAYFLEKGLLDSRILPIGHSVTAVYKKNE